MSLARVATEQHCATRSDVWGDERQKYLFYALAFIGSAIACLLGSLVEETSLATSFIIAISIVVGFVVVEFFPLGDRWFLRWQFLLGYLVRVAFCVGVYWYLKEFVGSTFLFSDDNTYDSWAWEIAQVWHERGFLSVMDIPRNPAYYYLSALIYYFTGHSTLAARLVNCLFGSLLIFPIYSIGKQVYSTRVGKAAAILVAFFPLLILWSAFQFKDILIALLVSTAIATAISLGNRLSIRRGIGLSFALVALIFMRREMAVIIGLLIVSYYLLNLRTMRYRAPITLAVVILGFATVTNIVFSTSFAGVEFISPEPVVSYQEQRLNSLEATGALETPGSLSIVLYQRASDPGSMLILLLARIAFSLVIPIAGLSNLPTLLMTPGALTWYALFPFFLLGLVYSVLRKRQSSFLIYGFVFASLLAMASTLNLSVRYKVQFEPLNMLLIAVAIYDTRKWHMGIYRFYVVGLAIAASVYLFLKL